jgi:metal-sulfur cluster biosynthetic enzyme
MSQDEAPISMAAIYDALLQVEDPDLGIDVVNLGLIYDVALEEQVVQIHMTLTSMGCPAAELLESEIKMKVERVPGVKEVQIVWTYDPPWTEALLSEEGRDMLLALGYL